MITSFVEESSTKKVLTLEVPAEEVAAATDETARSLGKNVRLPGFRPGKAPLAVIKKRFAEEIRGEVLERLVSDSVFAALKEKELAPLGQPKVSEVKFEVDAPLSFRVDVEIRPTVDPKDYRGLKVPTESTEPTDADVDAVLGRLRERHATYEPIEDRAAADGDFALVDIEGTFPAGDGEDFSEEKVLVEIGGAETLPELSANLRNAEAGVRFTFQKSYPREEGAARFAGKTVLYNGTLVALKRRVLPPLDDELARTLVSPREGESDESATLATLRERIAAGVRRDKEEALAQKRRRALLDGLLALNEVPAPESLVESEVDSALKEYARFMARQGVDLENASIDWNALRAEARPAAERRVKEYLLLDAIGEKEKIEATAADLDAELARRAAAAGMPPGELRKSLAKSHRLDGLREDLRLEKVVEFLRSESVTAA